jgi:hypothetical protein
VHAAVYPDLEAGRYQLWDPFDGTPAMTVEVAGGSITQARWGSPGDDAA